MYRITRMYFDPETRNRTIKRGLTLEEAQAHCSDPETSSSTAVENQQHTIDHGPWFDGYEEE